MRQNPSPIVPIVFVVPHLHWMPCPKDCCNSQPVALQDPAMVVCVPSQKNLANMHNITNISNGDLTCNQTPSATLRSTSFKIVFACSMVCSYCRQVVFSQQSPSKFAATNSNLDVVQFNKQRQTTTIIDHQQTMRCTKQACG